MKQRIALIVDHPLRDLGGLVLVAAELCRQGHDIFLVSMNLQVREILALNPDFVLLNYIRKNNESFIDAMIASNIPYGVLDTEGGFYGDLKKYHQTLSLKKNLWQNLKLNCVWGRKMLEFWLDFEPTRENASIHKLTGLPRFDFYHPDYHALADDFLNDRFKEMKNLILINTKVAVANPGFVTREQEVDLYLNKLGIPMADIQHHITEGEKQIRQLSELSMQLAADFPEAFFIVRPHPHENLKTYEKLIESYPNKNLIVYRDGNISPWLMKATAVIHRQCTTAVEAVLANKYALSPLWVATSSHAPDADIVSARPTTYDQLQQQLKAIINQTYVVDPQIENEKNRIIDDWLFLMDGKSYLRVAKEVTSVLPTLTNKEQLDKKQASIKIFFNYYKNHSGIKAKVYNILNQIWLKSGISFGLQILEKKRQANWINTPKSLYEKDINQWMNAIKKVEPAYQNIKVSKVTNEDLVISDYPSVSFKISKK